MKRSYAFLALLCVLLGACQSLGLAQPKSLSDRLAFGYATYSAVQYAAANAVTSGELSSADGEAVLRLGDQARALLDTSKGLLASDPKGASTNLTLALSVLTELQNYLRARKP